MACGSAVRRSSTPPRRAARRGPASSGATRSDPPARRARAAPGRADATAAAVTPSTRPSATGGAGRSGRARAAAPSGCSDRRPTRAASRWRGTGRGCPPSRRRGRGGRAPGPRARAAAGAPGRGGRVRPRPAAATCRRGRATTARRCRRIGRHDVRPRHRPPAGAARLRPDLEAVGARVERERRQQGIGARALVGVGGPVEAERDQARGAAAQGHGHRGRRPHAPRRQIPRQPAESGAALEGGDRRRRLDQQRGAAPEQQRLAEGRVLASTRLAFDEDEIRREGMTLERGRAGRDR